MMCIDVYDIIDLEPELTASIDQVLIDFIECSIYVSGSSCNTKLVDLQPQEFGAVQFFNQRLVSPVQVEPELQLSVDPSFNLY